MSRVDAIANGILSRAPALLHTAHCSRNNSAIDCYDRPWLDVNSTYSNCGGSLDAVREDWDRNPVQAFFFLEGNYEGQTASLGCLIDQAAWTVLSGGTGHVFGNRPIWLFESGWENALDSEGSVAMGHLADLFESRAWWRMRPDRTNAVVVDATGGTTAARTSDGESILVYAPSSRSLRVDLDQLSGTNAQAWWFDPVDGSVQNLGVSLSAGESDFDAPGRGLLVIDDAAAGLAAPGSEPY
jgi:hypothetical protein